MAKQNEINERRDAVVERVANDFAARFSLADIEGMSEKAYNHHGWVKVHNVLSDGELADFQEKVGQSARSKRWYFRLTPNLSMFAVGENGYNNKLVISDSDFNAPSIERVYTLITDITTETEIENVRRGIYGYEKRNYGIPLQALQEMWGNIIVFRDSVEDVGGYEESRREWERRKGERDFSKDRGLQNGERRYSVSESLSDSYSITNVDSDGNELSQEQREFFANSKVADEQGNLVPMYHGTSAEFTVFYKGHIGATGRFEGAGFNFTSFEGRAMSYHTSGQGNVFKTYLNVTSPLSDKEKTLSRAAINDIVRNIAQQEDIEGYDSIILAIAAPMGRNINEDYFRSLTESVTKQKKRRWPVTLIGE